LWRFAQVGHHPFAVAALAHEAPPRARNLAVGCRHLNWSRPMLLALLASACLALPSVPQVEDPAALVPQDTLVFFGTHSVRLSSQASKNSAMNRILAEPEVKAFLQKPVAAAQSIIDGALKDSGIAEVEGRSMSLTDMMSGSGDGPPLGKLFVALTHFALPAVSGDAEPHFPDVGLVVGVELLDVKDVALVKALWTKIPAQEETASHDGHEYFRKSGPEGWSVALTFLGNLAVASSSEKALFDVMSRYDGKTKGSLAQSVEYAKLVGIGGGLQPGASTSFVRLGAMVQIGKSALDFAAQHHPDFAEFAPKIGAAIDNLGMQALLWAGSVSSRDATGRVLCTSATSIAKGASGLIPRLLTSEQAFDLKRLERVPASSIGLTAGSIDGLGEVYDFLMSTFEAVAPEEYAEINGLIAQIMGTSDLRKDVFANLHGNFVSFSVPGEGFPGTPVSVLRVGLHDPGAFATAAQALVTNASQMFLADTPVTLTETDHEGHRFFELDLSRTPMQMMVQLQPAFAFDGNEFVGTLGSPKTLKSDLNGSAGTGSITENKELMDFIATLGKSGTVRSVGFSNNAATFGAVYGQLSGAFAMLGSGLGDLPIDLSLLPTEASITRHLGSSYAAGYADKDGTTFIERGVSQFAAGDFMPLLLTAAALGFAGASGESVVEAREATPEEQVQEDLAQINAGMSVYRISEGSYPASIDDLVRPLADFPEGCLGKSEAPVDPWGNAYRFKLNEKGKPFLWSLGPDGEDQQGAGDDLVKGKR
jgi:hypothetical protein